MKIEELNALLDKTDAPKPVKGLLGPAPQSRHLSIVTIKEEESLNLTTFIDRLRGARRHVDAHLGGVGE